MTEVRGVIESQFQKLQATVAKAQKEVTETLEVAYKQAMKQVEGIRVHLEQRCTELKKSQAQIEKLSRSKHDVDFLQVTKQNQTELPRKVLTLPSLENLQQSAVSLADGGVNVLHV